MAMFMLFAGLERAAGVLSIGVALGIFIMGIGLAWSRSGSDEQEHPGDGQTAVALWRGRSNQTASRPWLTPRAASLRPVFSRLRLGDPAGRAARQLLLAGSPFGWGGGRFLLLKMGSGCAGIALGVSAFSRAAEPRQGAILAVGLVVLGYLLPGVWLGRRIKARQRAILKALPDALDLLSLGVEAGLGLDGAFAEVVGRWDNPLSGEFAILLAELRLGRSRKEALRGLAHRTGVTEVQTFTAALIQADELGMGIARPLATQARRLRLKRRQHAERLAREASVKMVAVMALCIMPALFILILAPAILQLQAAFRR